MKKNMFSLPIAALIAMASSGTAFATNLDVRFTANVRETTCDMKLVGGTGSDTSQTLQIGADRGVRIEDFGTSKNRAGNAGARASFQLKIVECPPSLQSLKTTISGTPSGYLKDALINSIKKENGGADFSAVSIARASKPDEPFLIGSTDDSKRLVWSQEEIAVGEVPLVAILQATQDGLVTTGTFEATATFNFYYE
ncbi:fimbrial protein [Salmonella enterica]|uniref:Fimbrial protein n=1 Tax=Salmonella enterica subsp. salamae TaxID=59202 RepID=A0A6C8YGM1_SALER|nr:fimbrial protein [Salmonella enterica]EAB6844145.1 fimbrial protein [Salmonella enterica subsp. salamae]EDT2641261.1 fimbrial protein [Salmonella enterica subsp. enterica serovar Abony]MBA3000294.1 fimbrial protein [Salmonella enterica subsp. salamae serovar 3,10:b:e,n,x]EAZ4877183.1 fimbrial protein [Salmonella enterica]EBS6869433.1 fimbrial protein [Salmonella enterica]